MTTVVLLMLAAFPVRVVAQSSARSDTSTRVTKPTSAQERGNPASLFPITIRQGDDSRSGYIDSTGKVVVSPQFEGATGYAAGFATVRPAHTTKWCLLDRRGEIVRHREDTSAVCYPYPADFAGITPYVHEGLWSNDEPIQRRVDPAGPEISSVISLDTLGAEIPPPNQCHITEDGGGIISRFSDGFALFRERFDGPITFVDQSCKEALPPQFEINNVRSFSIGRAAAKFYGRWGFFNRRLELAIQPRFSDVTDFGEGLAAVLDSDGWNFIDTTGQLVIHSRLRNSTSFHEGLALVRADFSWGFMDRSGHIAIGPIRSDSIDAEQVHFFSDGLAAVWFSRRKLWGYIGRQGQVVIPPLFDKAGDFYRGLAQVVEEGSRPAWINSRGQVVWEAPLLFR